MEVTINKEAWKSGDKFLCPRQREGMYMISGEEFKFLQSQYEVIGKGRAFRFTGEADRIGAMRKCMDLVKQLNK